MAEKIVFELFSDGDADKAAELLSRNRFYIGQHGKITAEDYLFVQKHRGMEFSVVAKRQNKIIGMVAAYRLTTQKVAKPYQIFMGTLLIDIKYRLLPSVMIGLYDRLIDEIIERGYMEIISYVTPNTPALYVALKYGFVLLSVEKDMYGYLSLHNYFPTLARFLSMDKEEMSTDNFFANLPVFNKKEALIPKPLIHGRYIECEFKLKNETAFVLIDTINLKVDGVHYVNYLKFYPDFQYDNKYILENTNEQLLLDVSLCIISKDETEAEAVREEIRLAPNEIKEIVFEENVLNVELGFRGKSYNFFPNQFIKIQKSEIIELRYGTILISVDNLSGFISIFQLSDKKDEYLRIMWPCVSPPYIEGSIVPLEKNLSVTTEDNTFSIIEETDNYILKRICVIQDNKIEIKTIVQCKPNVSEIKPLSQLWLPKKARKCVVKSSKNSSVQSEDLRFYNYAFWEPHTRDEHDDKITNITLDFDKISIDVVVDDRSKPIIHIPNTAFFLPFDMEKKAEEQLIEQLEIYVNYEMEN